MVVPQSWVLYSRLHLLLREAKVLKMLRLVLVFNSVAFSVPTIIIGILAVSLFFETRNSWKPFPVFLTWPEPGTAINERGQ